MESMTYVQEVSNLCWMTSDDMKISKGPEFPVVALPSVGHMPAKGEDEQEAARVFYVAASRATQRLVIGASAENILEVFSRSGSNR
jgi:superfamily I DNA/RNA helicase